MLEVEQKFQLLSLDNEETIVSRLKAMGFVEMGPPKKFTDWYFDDPATFRLSLSDHWLRYREMVNTTTTGKWELKRRRDNGSSASSSTVYEELEGHVAIETALSFLSSATEMNTNSILVDDDNTGDFEGFTIPVLPTDVPHSLLAPFCRMETTRSSWKKNGSAIQVDLDTTDTNYAVGEVEIIVESEDEIPQAKVDIQTVIDDLLLLLHKENDKATTSSSGSPPGKLEHYLQTFRPAHYQVLIDSGVLKRQL